MGVHSCQNSTLRRILGADRRHVQKTLDERNKRRCPSHRHLQHHRHRNRKRDQSPTIDGDQRRSKRFGSDHSRSYPISGHIRSFVSHHYNRPISERRRRSSILEARPTSHKRFLEIMVGRIFDDAPFSIKVAIDEKGSAGRRPRLARRRDRAPP